MNDERAPVSFSVAKPVNPKTRHPFSGDPLELSPGEIDEAEQAVLSATPPESFRTVIADLKLRRAELDRAIDLLERLMP